MRAADCLARLWAGTKGQPCFCVGRPHGTCVPFTASLGVCRVINTEWDRCDGAGVRLCDPVRHTERETFKGRQNARLIPVLGLLRLLVTVVSVVKGSSSLALFSGGRAGAEALYVEGESIVDRIRTTSAR